ncbi:hypothetical protein [Rhizobium leguminosarum]|uniref:hypothetical protein n=1 Tax=Rhizobium leguminosarum TaxID=384 RepID=UPI00041A72DA|nr:hypothetical protein [Rhizobium leguminosarum]MBY5325541.1 hypothetical protein [Rhizobium leguminosarum]MBY5386128.1 hypothetical protein [Rhizobium leguminosarum]MCA2436810.1 hypothetical protein [Rhizobium leguminosarum]NEH46233.1 hypothetical protein [Rhizobium leguminosarum]NEH69161.1 hypothetical protein [Rhizobium leguminosarum]
MSDKENSGKKPLAAPMINRGAKDQQSLDLDGVEMSTDGRQGDVLVSKGRSRTFVTKANQLDDS